MGNRASAGVEHVPSSYREEIREIKKHINRVCKSWNADDFVLHREQAQIVIDVIKKMQDYLTKNRFDRSSLPILIQIYRLLDSLYSALEELRSFKEFWDFSPTMAAGLLSCGQDLADLGFWADRLTTDFALRIYPFTKYQDVRPDDDLYARTIGEIIEDIEGRRKGPFSSLELVGHSVLPYLLSRDREYIAEKLGKRIRSRKSRSLVDKKREFLRNIIEETADEDGDDRGLRPLHVVDVRDLSPGRVLLGSGSFGKVYRVEWLGSACAFKQLEMDKEYWMEEARILSRLRHPNIVTLFGCVHGTSSQPDQGILMELLGSNLHDIIFGRNRPFTNIAALDVMLQIARAMEYLHHRNIIHRDLKPANILASQPELGKGNVIHGEVVESLRVKLSDFGLAKVKKNGRYTEAMTSKLGSARYRAPEVLLGGETAHYNLSADVYSFAITSFEILTGNEGVEVERSKSNNDDFVIKMKTDLLQRCWDSTPRNRPSFQEICKLLLKMKHDLAIREGGTYR